MIDSGPVFFDLAVIGAGAGGLSVAAGAARLGLKVALVERARMGGECLNTGCVPSKALLAAARAAAETRRAGQFGVIVPPPRINWATVRAHVASTIAALEPMDSKERFERLGVTVLRGTARFTGPDEISVEQPDLMLRVRARRFVVATGSRPRIPDIPGLDALSVLTNETLFDLPTPPTHLLILGGGPMGLEMAQAFARLGRPVTVLEQGTIAGREEAALVRRLRDALAADGVRMLEGVRIVAAEPGPTLVLASGIRIVGSHLLVAAGRQPVVEELGLDLARVSTTANGIATDLGLRSLSNTRVFAVGDVADPQGVGPRRFTHVAGVHAAIVIRRAAFRLPARLSARSLPRVTYTDPELAHVGMTETEARATRPRRRIRTIRLDLTENDRAWTERRTEGMATLVLDHRGRLLGASVLAPGAGEIIGLWALALARRISLSSLAGLVLPYPTFSEIGTRAVGRYFEPKVFGRIARLLVRCLTRIP